MLRKLVIALAALSLWSVVSFAQTGATLLDDIKAMGTVSLNYSVKGLDKTGKCVATQKGVAYVQGDCYRIESDELKVYCNGESMWMYTPDTEELVISANETLPLLGATDARRRQDGTITASYAANDMTFKVEISGIKSLKEKFPADYFVLDESAVSENVIVTDLR